MDEIEITGGRRLTGKIDISGSKNAALPVLIATLLSDESCMIENVPRLRDIDTTVALLENLGKAIERAGNRIIIRNNPKHGNTERLAPYELMKRMRASFLVAGPLLAKYGEARVSLPGGCAIGVRPVDIHIKGFQQMGAKAKLEKGYVMLSCRKLKGGRVVFSFPSVGATENIMTAAAFVNGKTVICNAAREPEISDLADFLNKLGAKITGYGTPEITVRGTPSISGANHEVIPDRIETGTYLMAGAITRGSVRLEKCRPAHLKSIIDTLRKAGAQIECTENSLSIDSRNRLKPVNIVTKPYPGFPTDLQAQWMTLMCTAEGSSIVRESVFENRFLHVAELQRLGAELRIKEDSVLVKGGSRLTGATVMVSDLRAGAAMVLAGLIAKGRTTITRVYHLDRGYEGIENKLKSLGADIRRVKK